MNHENTAQDESGLDAAQTATIQIACMALVARYCHCADLRLHKEFSELFAPEGEWIRPGMHMKSRDDILRFMDARSPKAMTRHVCGSIHIEVVDADHARGFSYTTVYREPDYKGPDISPRVVPEMVVDYRDDYVRIDGRWHFGKRHTTVVFSDKA